MRSFTFTHLLEEAASVLDLSRRLGEVCMDRGADLKRALDKEPQGQLVEEIAVRVQNSDPVGWTAVIRRPSALEVELGEALAESLAKADTLYPLDCLAVLRGLCRGVLPHFYAAAEGPILLDRGMPVPFATRRVCDLFPATPYQETLSNDDLLPSLGHRMFEFSSGEAVQVALDFAERARIDELTWAGKARLPRIATVHPDGCGEVEVHTITDREFFDARPARWNADRVLDLLRQVSDVEIAVLPELSMPGHGDVERALARDPGEFPPLVIAGSVHLRERSSSGNDVRANESRVYLDGRLIGAHRKCHPYVVSKLAGKVLRGPLREALTGEQKTITVLSGEHSRLAVVICADLNDQYIPSKLLAAGVNLLVVPSFTHQPGAFNGPICDLASRCQGVSAIANAPPDDAPKPFHGMAAVPRSFPATQSATYPLPGQQPTEIAVFDPNERLENAITWR